LEGKDFVLPELDNLCDHLSVDNHQNVLLNTVKSGDLELLRQVLARRDEKEHPFALSWDTTSRLEDCYHTVRTRKECVVKGKKEGVHALIQDRYQSQEDTWWKIIGLDRLL
jgi:hypothetical protein